MRRLQGSLIRRLNSDDEDFIREILFHAVYVGEDDPPLKRSFLDEPRIAPYTQDFGKKEGDFGYAFVNKEGRDIGAAWLRFLPLGYAYLDDETPELTVGFFPGYTGRGYGSELLTRLLEAAKDQYPAVCLSVDRRNRAQVLYRRLGFVPLRMRGIAIIMRRVFRERQRRGEEC